MVETNEFSNPQPPAPNANCREGLVIVLSQYLQCHLGLVTACWGIVNTHQCHYGQLDLEVIHFIGCHQNSRLLPLLGFRSSKERAMCECVVSELTPGGCVWRHSLGDTGAVEAAVCAFIHFQPSVHPAFFTVASTRTITAPWTWEPC